MKVVLLTSDYYISANIAVREFLRSQNLERNDIEIAAIVSASNFDMSKRLLKRSWKFLHQSGFKFFAYNVLLNIWKTLKIRFGKWFVKDSKREYFSIGEMAKVYKIPFLHVSDINSKESEAFIKKFKPDFLASCLLLQIAKKNILDLPSRCAINFHPALTQKHRGAFGAFWALLKNWKHSGATVHFMTEDLDSGKVILQRRFFIHPSDTLYSLNEKSARLGGRLLAMALVKLKRNINVGYFLNNLGNKFTMPTEKEVKHFFMKKKFIKIRDFFKV